MAALAARSKDASAAPLSAEEQAALDAFQLRKSNKQRKAEAADLEELASTSFLNLVVNCAYDCNSEREERSLCHQLLRVYAANKRHRDGAACRLTVWHPSAEVQARLNAMRAGDWAACDIVPRPAAPSAGAPSGTAASAAALDAASDATADAAAGAESLAALPLVASAASRARVVMLTPDSSNVLEDVAADGVFVIGGIVDRTIRRGQTLLTAERLGVAHARLPLQEVLGAAGAAKSVVLNVDTVAEMLLRRRKGEEWAAIVPEMLSPRVARRSALTGPGEP